MSDATERFSGRAVVYERYRQRYPSQQILAHLKRWCGLEPTWKVADIGAGTGMLTEIFLENGNDVVAIEPNAEMRRVCRALRTRWPELQIADATAEATNLAPGSVDLVAAGRAFHWFHTQRALNEFRRIAKPQGWLVLVALGRADDADKRGFGAQAAAFEQLLTRLGTDYTEVRATFRVHDTLRSLFAPDRQFHHAALAGEQELEWDVFRGQTMSLSVTPQSGHANYTAFQQELRSLFERFARDGRITIPTTCHITAAQL